MPDKNGILKNPGIEDRDRPEDESPPDPPGEVRSNAVYEDRFFGRLHAGPAEPYMRRIVYHGVHDLLRLLKENLPTESTCRAAPPQSATGAVLTTQRTCTPKSKDETSRRNKGNDPEPQLIIRRHLSGEPLIFSKQPSQEVPTKQPKTQTLSENTHSPEKHSQQNANTDQKSATTQKKTSTASNGKPGTNQPIQKRQQNREHPRIHRTGDPRRSKRPRTCILHTP